MQLSSYEETLWRTERLEKALRVAAAVLGMTEDQLSKLVVKLHDYKGFLQVTWDGCHPTDRQVDAFSVAWSLCKEPKDNVEHFTSEVN